MNHGSWRPVDSIMIVTCRKPVRNNTEKRLKHPVARFSRCIIEFSAGAQPASLGSRNSIFRAPNSIPVIDEGHTRFITKTKQKLAMHYSS
jgi:hypothetical protein